MGLIPTFVVFIIAVIWKTEQEAKRHFAERNTNAASEGRIAGSENRSAKS